MAFYSENEIRLLGFKKIGKNVLLSKLAAFYNPGNISIGDNTRIDDFCILSAGDGGIDIGNYVHIACYVSLIGKGKIEINDFAGLSSKTAIYSSTDDFSGLFLTGPTVLEKYRNVITKKVVIGKHVIIGAGVVILPGCEIGEGSAVASLSFVNKDIPKHKIYGGVPAKYLKDRSKNIFELEQLFLNSNLQ